MLLMLTALTVNLVLSTEWNVNINLSDTVIVEPCVAVWLCVCVISISSLLSRVSPVGDCDSNHSHILVDTTLPPPAVILSEQNTFSYTYLPSNTGRRAVNNRYTDTRSKTVVIPAIRRTVHIPAAGHGSQIPAIRWTVHIPGVSQGSDIDTRHHSSRSRVRHRYPPSGAQFRPVAARLSPLKRWRDAACDQMFRFDRWNYSGFAN